MDSQVSLFDDNPEYDAFVAKFKPKKTTDDCYTPPLVYEAVKTWACKEYDIDPDGIVRPFYPGGDYEHYVYPSGCTVLDNPPFSILTKICEFYIQHNIMLMDAVEYIKHRNRALKKEADRENNLNRLIKTLKYVIGLSDFELVGRIVLLDNDGREYR